MIEHHFWLEGAKPSDLDIFDFAWRSFVQVDGDVGASLFVKNVRLGVEGVAAVPFFE